MSLPINSLLFFIFSINLLSLAYKPREISLTRMHWRKALIPFYRIITPLSALIQSSCQTVLIMDAWRRRCTTVDQMQRKPGRQLITFLLLTNIALWMGNRLKNNLSFSHPNQMDFYGVLVWNIITHVSIPLVVSYRFQSTVCFYEIWKHVYKMRPINKELNEFNHDSPLWN